MKNKPVWLKVLIYVSIGVALLYILYMWANGNGVLPQ